jgi:hypothetical protein
LSIFSPPEETLANHCTYYTLAARGLEELFSVVVLCQFLVLALNRFLVLHTYVLRVQYSCGVVLVFWFWREIVFGLTYVLSVRYSCAVVSVYLVVAGNRSLNENTFLQKSLIGLLFSITAYLFLVLYRTTSLQSRPFCGSLNR